MENNIFFGIAETENRISFKKSSHSEQSNCLSLKNGDDIITVGIGNIQLCELGILCVAFGEADFDVDGACELLDGMNVVNNEKLAIAEKLAEFAENLKKYYTE